MVGSPQPSRLCSETTPIIIGMIYCAASTLACRQVMNHMHFMRNALPVKKNLLRCDLADEDGSSLVEMLANCDN